MYAITDITFREKKILDKYKYRINTEWDNSFEISSVIPEFEFLKLCHKQDFIVTYFKHRKSLFGDIAKEILIVSGKTRAYLLQ